MAIKSNIQHQPTSHSNTPSYRSTLINMPLIVPPDINPFLKRHIPIATTPIKPNAVIHHPTKYPLFTHLVVVHIKWKDLL